MTWRYQLMRHTEPDGEVWYGVHEAYGYGVGYTVEPVRMAGDCKEDVKWMLEKMLEDIEIHGVKDYE